MSIFSPGLRPWKRQTEAKRALDSSVPAKGELTVSDNGGLYIPDGSTQAKNLPRVLTEASGLKKPTGTPNGSKFLRDDNTWQNPPSPSGSLFAVDNGDGTVTFSGAGVVDNGDGTFTIGTT